MSEINDFLDGKQSSEIDSFLGPDAPKPAGAIRKVADLGLSVGKGVIAVPEAAVGLANLVTGGHAGKLAESAGVRFKDAKDVLTGWQSDDFKGKQQQFQQADGILEKTGVALSNPSLIANTVAESLPLMGAGGVGARALLGAAPKIGAATAGAIGEGIAGAGSSGEQYRQESTDGLLTGKQAALAGASGAATAAFGAAGGKLAQKLGIGDIDTMLAGGTTRVAAGAAPKGAIRRMAEGAASEGLLEELPQSLSEQGFQNVALDRPVTQGMEDAGVMGVLTGGVMGAGAGAISRQAQPAPNQAPTDQAPPTGGVVPPPAPPAGPTQSITGTDPAALMGSTLGGLGGNANSSFLDGAREAEVQQIVAASGGNPGALAKVAIASIQSGASGEIQLQQANEADQAAYEQATAEQDKQAAEQDSIDKPITSGPIAEAAMSDDDKRAIMFSNKTVADGGIQYPGTLDGDILNGQTRPYKRWEEAIRRVKMEGKDWRVAKVQDGFVARRKDANGPSTEIQSGDTGSAGVRSTDSPASVGAGATDGNGVGAQSGRSPDAVLDQAGELPKRVDAAPVATTRAQPTTLGKQTTATAGLGFTAKDVTRVPNPAPRADTTPAAQAVEAPAVVESNAAASEGVPAAGSVAVEGDGIDQAAHAAATSPLNDLPQPTDGQKDAGNYKKGHVNLNGLDLSIENPAGSVRSGKDKSGKAWSNTLQHHYGYIKGTIGNDKDHVDLFVKPSTPTDYNGPVFVIDQVHPDTGRFDEHKVVVGAKNGMEARRIYQANYAKGWKGLKAMTPMPFDQFKTWVKDGPKNKPLSSEDQASQPTEKPNGTQAPETQQAEAQQSQERAPGQPVEEQNLQAAKNLLAQQKAATGNAVAEGAIRKKLRDLAAKTPISDAKTVSALDIAATRLGMGEGKLKGLEFAPAAAPVSNTQTADAPELSESTKARNLLMELQAKQDANGMVGDDRLETQINQIKREIAKLDDAQAEKPGTVNVPPTVAEAFTAQMQKQKGRITRLKNEADKAGSLEDKKAAQLKVTAAEATLRQMRLKIFDAEDAAVKSVEQGITSPFNDFADLFQSAAEEIAKLTGQNDELDAEMRSYEVKQNPTYSGQENKPQAPVNKAQAATNSVAKDALSDREKAAKAKMHGALGKLAALASKNTRMNWTQEEEQQLLPIVIELFDGAMELGAVSFQQAVAYVRDFITTNLDSETADAIPFDTLQGAYISVAGRHKDKGVTSKKEVVGYESLEELANSLNTADTPAKDTQNATLKLDSTSPSPLEGVSTEQVSGTGEVASTGESPDGSGRGDPAGNGSADSAGVQVQRGVGSDTGAVPIPARGKRSKRGSTGQSGIQGDAGIQPGLGFVDTAGGTGGLIPANPAPNAAPIPAPAFADFAIEDDFALGEGGQKTKFKANIEAIRLLQQLDAEGRMATPTEQAVLAKYVGWGGLAQAFDEKNADWSKEYAELKGLMSADDYADARVSTRYAHFTSRQVVQDGIYAALAHFGFNGGRALEGGAGVGNFIGLMPATMRSASRFTAIEREPFSAKIARNLYPQQNVQEADFTEFVGNDDFYDVAVGNPPFASDPQVDRSGRKHLSGLSLHNYFFAKEVDMLREGGILAQVITNSFLDAQTDTARKYIAEKTKLLGAIRLPNNAFSKNANTEVTTDLIFLQKLPESEWGGKAARANAKEWLSVGQITDAEGRTVALNQYFIDHPDMMLGKFGAYGTMYRGESPALVQKPGQDTAALLKEAVSKLPANVYVDRAITNTASLQDALIKTLQNPQVQEGGYFEEDGKLFQRIKDIAGEARAQEVTAQSQWTEKTKLGDNGFNRIKSLAGMRSTVRSLLAAELANDASMEALRKTLNDQYDAYSKDHGRINDPGTIRVFGDDPDFPLLASLEYGYTPAIGLAAAKSMGIKMVPSTATKGPIFTRRVIDARQQVAKVESPSDALNVSMAERGKLDTKYIGELLGKDADEALHELSGGDSPLLFNDPATGEYVLRDAYLSGNVRAKLVQAKQAGMFNNIKALEAVQPEDVGAHEINARIGSPWVPESVYQDFAKSLLGEGTDASIKYVKASGGYSSYIHAGSETANTNTWGTPDYRGSDILSALLNNKPIKVTFKDPDGKTHTDVTGTENANAKAQDMRNRFQDWLFADADRAELLGRAYNDTNNNYVTRQYDGAWMTFPGKVPNAIVEFRRHQRNAIARIVQDRTALLDHVVGSGKTYTIIAAAMELRRTGLAKKPMIAVPNHLVKQWAADFYKLYPGANILTATKKDFEKVNRRKFLAKIATGDWDAVIIAHSSYGFIRPAPDFEAAFNTKQVENIVKTIREVDNGDGDKQQKKRTIKQLEGIKERLENRIKALRDKPMDALLDFGELGVDQLFVDEAHMFKNLMFSTKMQNIAGLGDSKGSQRAYDMYVKANQLYERNGRGQGVVFATGTPVSNSLAEMYHMMRYLMPKQMEEMGFESFDAWANTYASVEQVWMQKASADGFKAQNRMSNFVNTPELLKVFDQVSDTVTMEDVKKAFSEENAGREFPLPKLKGGKRTPMSLRKSAAQESYMSDIAKRALALEQRKGPPQKGEDNILVIMSDARKAAMDVRLVDPTITAREAGGRIDRASQELFSRYTQYNDVKGTQLVFSDLGTPLKTAKKELAEYQALKDRIEAGYGDELVGRAALGDEAAQAKIDDAEDAQEELEAKGRDWLGAMQAAERGFSVYDDLKAALIEKGIPEGEIAFIHDYNTDEQKAGLFRKVNSGQIRVLLGSTQKLGAGTNVQERLVALHHLDVPWKPSDVEQREGRIIRQGNTLAPVEGRTGGLPGFEVEILAYVTQDTLDMRMWQVQETKLKMINQLRTRKIGRDIENAFEDLELSAGEMQAAATGNIDLLREIQIKGEIKKLEQRKRAFDAQKSDLQSRKKSVAQKLESLPAKIESSKGMAEASDQYRKELADIGNDFKATIDGKDYTDPKEAGAVLLAMIDNKVYMQRQADGKYGGRQLTEAQVAAEPEQDKKAADYNPWVARPVPLSVNMNGEVFTSRDKLTEAFSNLRGDKDPIAWTMDGKTFNRRTQIEGAIRQAVADSIAEEQVKEVGQLGPFTVSVEGQSGRYEKVLDVVLTYKGQTISNARGLGAPDATTAERTVPVVVRMAENLAVSARQQHEYEKRQLEQAKKEKAELEQAAVLADWPDQPKLEELRKKHQEVLKNLSSAGVATTADGETLEGAMGAIPDATGNTTDVAFSRPKFSRGAQSQANESVERLARGIASHWENPPNVAIAFDMDDPAIPESVRKEDQRQRSGGASGTPEGFYFKGTVYLMSSKLGTPNDVARVLFHEALGHAGLRGAFGGSLEPILREVSVMRRAEVDAKLKQYGLKGINKIDRLIAAEEVLAELAQTRPDIGFVKRAIAAIRTWLRQNVPGFNNLRLSDNELIQNYILPARAWVERGGPGGGGGGLPAMSRADQTDTPAFRKWFGDSKVVDDNGKPLVVYHGSTRGGIRNATVQHSFFTSSQDVARTYSEDDYSGAKGEDPIVQEVFLRMENPLVADAEGNAWMRVPFEGKNYTTDDLARLAKKRGHDGVIIKNLEDNVNEEELPPSDVYITLGGKAQIKSATGNNGDFDAENPDIRFSRSLGDTLASATNSVRDVALPAGYKVNDLIGSVPGKLNWWHRSVGTMYNLAQRSAPFKRVFDSVQTFINDVSYYATEAADLAPNILPKLETWKDIAKSPLSAADTKAISAPIFEGTLIWARDESGKPVKVETLEAAAAQLTPEQKAQRLLRGDHISQQVLKMLQGLPVDQFETIINGKYERDMLKAGVVWTDAELKSIFNLTDKQIPLYREFRKATDKSLTNLAIADMLRFGGEDVMPIREQVLASKDVSEASETLRDYLLSLTDLDPDRADVLTDTADKMIEKGDRAKDLIDRGYAPLSRFGQYTLDVVHDGERVYFSMFESKWEAARMNRQMQAEYPGAKITQGTVSEQAYKMFAGVSPETLELFGDMLGLEAQGDDASAKAFQEYLKLAKSSRSAMKRLIHRKGIAGFNEDAGRVLAGFVYSNARQTASSLHMGEMTNAANDISQTQGELKDAAVKLVDYIKNPQEEAQKLRGLLFAQYIGGSVASAMVNMTQPLTMTFPWLSQYGGVASAAKQMTAAMKDSGKKLTGDAKLDAALHRAEEDGTVSPQEVHQLLQQSMGKGALQSGDGTTAGNAMATANNTLSRFSLGWGKLFSVAEQFNRRVTFIAAYRTAVTQGMADPDAFARKAVAETQGIYNRGNKPQWARGALGSTLFTFKQYSIAYVEMLSRMAKAGKPGSKERAQGQKAALLALGVLFLMSGAGGIPGADDLDDLISGALQALGYNFDSKARRKEFFVSLFGEGGAQFVERGVSGLPGVPIDVSGRMGLGNLVPGTGLFTKKTDHTRDVAELAGPAGDLAKRTFEAAGKLIKGDAVGSAVSVSPKAFQNLHQAYDMANMGMYRDASGKKVVDTDGYDAIAKAIGFQPTDVKRIQDASIEVQRMIGLNKMRESEIADKWALGMFEKNPAKVEDARNDLKTWNADNPSSPIRINFGQIIKRVQKMNETKTQRIAKTAPREIRETVRRELATQ